MKHLTIFILLFAAGLFAQDNKGSIGLTFNGEEISLPVNVIKMEKTKNILISARAESNDENLQLIALDMTLTKLNIEEEDPLQIDNFRLEVKTRRPLEEESSYFKGKEFLLSFAEGKEACRFSIYSGEERVNWETRALAMRLNISSISYENERLKITGEVSVTLRSTLDGFYLNEVAKIENGKFTIII